MTFDFLSLDFYVKQSPKKSFADSLTNEGSSIKSPLSFLGKAMILSGALMLFYLFWIFVSYQKEVLSLKDRLAKLEVLGSSTAKDDSLSSANGSSAVSSFGFGNLLKNITQNDPGLNIKSSDLENQKGVLGLKSATSENVPSEFYLTIPSLSLDKVKVRPNVDGANKEVYLPVLKEAVGHYLGTALPGETGNVLLFGHSTLPILAHGQYEAVFTELPKIQKKDQIIINYNNRDYYYQVIETKVAEPNDLTVLYQPTNKKLLTLMTCIPPGIGTQRFLAIAELIPL